MVLGHHNTLTGHCITHFGGLVPIPVDLRVLLMQVLLVLPQVLRDPPVHHGLLIEVPRHRSLDVDWLELLTRLEYGHLGEQVAQVASVLCAGAHVLILDSSFDVPWRSLNAAKVGGGWPTASFRDIPVLNLPIDHGGG